MINYDYVLPNIKMYLTRGILIDCLIFASANKDQTTVNSYYLPYMAYYPTFVPQCHIYRGGLQLCLIFTVPNLCFYFNVVIFCLIIFNWQMALTYLISNTDV